MASSSQAGGDNRQKGGVRAPRGVLEVIGRSASNVTQSPSLSSWRCPSRQDDRPSPTSAVSRLPGSCIGGHRPPRSRHAERACGARAPLADRAGKKSSPRSCAPPPVATTLALARAHDRDSAVLVETEQLGESQLQARGDASGDREGWAFSPRSTCESIGALTPLRSARSRSDSEADSRSAFTRAPMTTGDSVSECSGDVSRVTASVVIQAYVITDTRVIG